MVKLILDTDIGSDIDDAVCLAYLLAQPEAELLGVTTVSGQPEQRAALASVLCKVAGRDVPIYPGCEAPLEIDQRQPTAPQAAVLPHWPHTTEFPKNGAVAFMKETIRANPGEVTLLAIGPLTNVARLFLEDPGIPVLLKSLVVMSGCFYLEKVEWNVECDPHAAAVVYSAGVPALYAVGLDVTMQTVLPKAAVYHRFNSPLLQPVLDFAEVWFAQSSSRLTFHDPLAAAVIFDPEICTFERGRVSVAVDGDSAGRTTFQSEAMGPHHAAARVDIERYFSHFFKVF